MLYSFPKSLATAPSLWNAHEDISALLSEGFRVWPVGSQTIPGAAGVDSDHDFLVLSSGPAPHVVQDLGYELDVGSKHYEPSEGAFNSWRKNNMNLILTYDVRFASKFMLANAVARKLSLLFREDRVVLFQAILYGASPFETEHDPTSSVGDLENEIPF